MFTPGRDPACIGFPDTSGILLVMKTGATESFEKIPVQLMTALRCLPDFLIFSDLDQQIGGFHLRDSLDTVLSEAKHNNPDFDLYRAQQACAVDQHSCAKAFQAGYSYIENDAWDLDKYKNIHMAEKAYRLRPNYDWYVFVDADTYVSWPNMVEALGRMNPAKARFLGMPTVIGPYTFAHGGSGYVLSRGALSKFAGANPGIANKYDIDMRNHCCGDYMFARVVKNTSNIDVEGFWPLSNGEKPYTVQLGRNHWCHPVGMMHHMNSEEISSFWEFERRRYRTNKKPLLFSEVFDEFIASKISARRDDWDNGADEWFYLDFKAENHEWEDWRLDRAIKRDEMSDLEKVAHMSFESCKRACLHHEDCFQFMWHNDCCAMHSSMRLGQPMRKKLGEHNKMRFLSGWDMAKVRKWVAEHDCKDEIEWPEAVELYPEGSPPKDHDQESE
ncbi:glycosyltransferase family 31 protein [Coniella lustricola]|uniref:N-acetylgalactosaminide beta-1,3-galactosyltransferase n=1 Tax=Coniella lustricola TaxID=2025994 RepID=A0A2T3AIJ1_9PEZI|nr:glycosyltransferase family 31 protein [Coniella lustricola]